MSTDVPLSVLDRISVASRCTARWEDMTPLAPGDERVRHCGQCNLSVHNLSAMSREEAEELLRPFAPGGTRHGERVCSRWRQRADGTVILGDCPVGWAKARQRTKLAIARLAALVGVTSMLAGLLSMAENSGWNPRENEVFARISGWIGADAARRLMVIPPDREELMGDVHIAPDR